MRYIENIPHHSLFKHFQGYSGTFSTVEPCSGILRDIKSFWGIFRHYQGILSHFQAYSEFCVNLSIYNCSIFWTYAHLESETSSKTCRTCKMIRHIQNPGIIKTLFKHFKRYLWIFGDIDVHSGTIRRATRREGGGLPWFFLRIKKHPILEKKAPIMSIFVFKI